MSTRLHKELMDYAQDQGLRIVQASQKKHLKILVELPSGERRMLAVPKGGNNCAINNWKAFTRRLAQGKVPPRGT